MTPEQIVESLDGGHGQRSVEEVRNQKLDGCCVGGPLAERLETDIAMSRHDKRSGPNGAKHAQRVQPKQSKFFSLVSEHNERMTAVFAEQACAQPLRSPKGHRAPTTPCGALREMYEQ